MKVGCSLDAGRDTSPLFEIAGVLVCLDHVASIICKSESQYVHGKPLARYYPRETVAPRNGHLVVDLHPDYRD